RAVLAAWKAEPKRAQDKIQDEVWTKAEPLGAFEEQQAPEPVAAAVTRERKADETALPADTAEVLVVKGEVAVLTSRGDVLVGPGRSPLRTIASDAKGIAAEGKTLHVLFAKSPLSDRPAIARYDLEKKKFQGELGAVATRLLWARKDAAVIERDGEVLLVDRENEQRLSGAVGAKLVDTGKGAVLVAPTDREGETRVVRLQSVGRRVDVKKTVAPVRLVTICSIGERVYASDDAGGLLALRSFEIRPVRVGEILGESNSDTAVRRVIGAKARLLIETDQGTFLLQKEGSVPLEVGVDPAATFLRDSVTGELYGLVGRSLRRWDDGRAGWIDVRVE
ncbi:MAG: hypothetical protein ACAI25_19275, partial [Planctomycetota bacterium]